jgi:transcriptional regulator with XRE-family HTH domain
MKLPRLLEWRERRALTQVQLAAAAGVSQDMVSKVERGLRGVQPRTARRLAQALEIAVAELVAPPEVAGDPKQLAPKLLERRLRSEGVETAWALADVEVVLAEGERLGNEAMREQLIPTLRVEQKALRQIAADHDLPLEVRDHASALDEAAGYRMRRLLLEARRRERTSEGKKALDQAERELLDLLEDAG